MPKKMHENRTEVPPQLTIGKVRPPTGTRWTEIAIFARAWMTMFSDKPIATMAPKDFSLIITSLVALKNSITYSPSNIKAPNKPYSSQKIA